MKVLDKTRLIFSFYLTNENLYDDINQLHLRLLSKYINRFDDVIFCIIVNDDIADMVGEGYTNFALFGGDSRSGDVTKNLNTDSIIIVSLNNETKEVKMVSVYRDTLLDMTNGKIQKCNSAYSRGGATQAINMLNMNLDLDIKKYVTVDFGAVSELVDMLGGIEINVSDKEWKEVNKYIDETEPWVLAKDPEKADRLATVMYNLVEGITIGASLLQPFMPETAEKIMAQLNGEIREFDKLETFGLRENGVKVTDKPQILFARLDAKEIVEKAEAMYAARRTETAGEAQEAAGEAEAEEEAVIDIEAKEEITYDDFAKLQFQVGEIIACEAVPKSKKLLCSQVKVGSQVRQIVSGIKAHYTPEEMVGKKVMVLVNLKPAKLAGILSEGMLLCAEDAEGNLALMTPEKAMPAGAEIC